VRNCGRHCYFHLVELWNFPNVTTKWYTGRYWDSLGYPQMSQMRPVESTCNTGLYKTIPGIYKALELRSGRDNTTTKIKHRAPTCSNKSLGVLTSPSGQWQNEEERMKTKRNKHTVLTMSHSLNRYDAIQAHRTIWAPQMTYSLPITRLTDN
jgi:hypothetical protein